MPAYEELMPVSRPSIGEEELNEMRKVFESRWLGMGAWVFRFEERLKDFIGAPYAIATNTGTTALHLALDAMGIGKGDEVIVPSLTFVGSVQPIMATGASPVFCDVEEQTLNMDIDDMKKRISRKTKAIMPVHLRGLPCDMDAILDIAGAKKIRIVEDAAHAFGSYYKNRKIGSFGDVTCFSFDPIKNITCGEGGAVTTHDKKLAEIIYKKRILGIDKDTWNRYKHKRDWFYNVSVLGYRYHMSNINAAIGLVQMEKFGRFNDRKKEIAGRYDDAFRQIKGIELLKPNYDNAAPFNYIIKARKRDALMGFLKSRGIDSGVHYIPNHIQSFFGKFSARLPVTERVWRQIVTLPLYYDMNDKNIERVINMVKEFFN